MNKKDFDRDSNLSVKIKESPLMGESGYEQLIYENHSGVAIPKYFRRR